MHSMKLFSIMFLILIASTLCFGQEIFYEDGNWLREFDGLYSRNDLGIIYKYETYTREDVKKAKQKLQAIKQSISKDEWEGIYYRNVEIGDDMMIWDSQSGFFSFYHYHELRRLNYGKVQSSKDSIKLISEKILDSKSDKTLIDNSEKELVKIKFGERHFLVPKNILQDFINETAGLTTSRNFIYIWSKQTDMYKKVFGIPILPTKYKHLLIYPIEAKITEVGNKKVIPNKQSTEEYNFDDIHYPLTLSTGRDKNVKVGMDFYVEDLGEWIKITKVFQKKSIGYIRRDFDEKRNEVCFDGRGGYEQIISCKEIKLGMKAITKTNL